MVSSLTCFTYSLGFLMLSMGLTLTVEDFKMVRRPSGAWDHSMQGLSSLND